MFGYRGRPSQLSKSDQRRPVQLIECRNPVLERLLALPHARTPASRSEEHTSELQSLMRISYAVFCLKKKNQLMNNNLTLPLISINTPIETQYKTHLTLHKKTTEK